MIRYSLDELNNQVLGKQDTLIINTIIVNIPKATYTYSYSFTDVSAVTTSSIHAFPNGLSVGAQGGDELEMSPIIVNAYCSTNGIINIIINSSQGQIVGAYGVSYIIY